MRRVLGGMTYSNVMATVAVFIALGGGAYALSTGEVESRHIARDAVKAKHIDFGVRSQVMLANFSGLGTGSGEGNYAPVGASGPGSLFHEMETPQTFVATGLRVRVWGPVTTGTRTFELRYFDYDANQHVTTDVACEVGAGEGLCTSNERARIPAASSLYFQASYSGTTDTDYAEVGWRAVLP